MKSTKVELLEIAIKKFLKTGDTIKVKNIIINKETRPYRKFLSELYLNLVVDEPHDGRYLITIFTNKYISENRDNLSIKIFKWCDVNDIKVFNFNKEKYENLKKNKKQINS